MILFQFARKFAAYSVRLWTKTSRHSPTWLSKLPATLQPRAAVLPAGDVGVMFFLLRMAFWLGVVLLLLPTGAAQRSPSVSEVNASEAISAASATVGDVRGFCTRQPDACTVGSQVATAIGYKAEAGAKMLYEVLSEAMAPRETGTIPRHTVAAHNRRQGCVGAIRGRAYFAEHLDACRSCAVLARAAAAQRRQTPSIAKITLP